MSIEYGKVTKSTTIDDPITNKSVVKSVTTNFRRGEAYTTITRYEVRIKVKDENEELAEYVRFRKEKKAKSEFRTEPNRNGDGYYVIKVWEE
jgi:hypothetical protein